MGLTDEQKDVINTRDQNMLVSAAAGSGKTFVLVKRIISKVINERVDVDKILVVTFTNAAAAEMKERIRKALNEALEENPNDAFLRKQATLIHNAQIRTIDSFCSWLVKNYFYEIDIEPSFRIAAKGEKKMLEDEVLSEQISAFLAEDDEDFMLLADAYMTAKNSDTFKKMVNALREKAASFPWPDEWYESVLDLYNVEILDDLPNQKFMIEIINMVNIELDELIAKMDKALKYFAEEADSPDKTIIQNELAMYKMLRAATSYEEKYDLARNFDFTRYNSKGSPLSAEGKTAVKDIRDECKKKFQGDIAPNYLSLSLEQIYDSLILVGRQAKALIRITQAYSNALLEKKNKKCIYDFNDIEHMALNILRNPNSKEHEVRAVAKELSQHFYEVMVDEYQDSNDLQEAILTAVSNGNNYFTVGDIKQSIYAFRQASPDLFREKLIGYEDGSKTGKRIDLDKNFRSRAEVLDFCNAVFTPLMQEDMGHVAYDDKASLKLGVPDFLGTPSDYEPEILIGNYDDTAKNELNLKNSEELEALIIAKKINKLMTDGFKVNDEDSDKNKILRPLKYSDIVILMRSNKAANTFVNTLKNNKIPAFIAEEKGFFEQEEIEAVLNMLTVIDNPFNDIALAAVMHSPIFGFSSEQLAAMRLESPKESFYKSIFDYCKDHPDDVAATSFIITLNRLREAMVDTPIHEMIQLILDETGYGLYVKALPLGVNKTANLQKLIDEAINFESTSYQGLSKFVSYIEGLKTFDEEFGLAKTVGENDDAVRIMTMHKSKGLEFPLVFVSRCGVEFKNNKGDFVYNKEFGLALNYKNPRTRVKYTTPFRSLIADKEKDESRGEEQRILYVALTRAKEKLIITGCIKPSNECDALKKIASYSEDKALVSYSAKRDAASYLEWIIRALNASGISYNRKIISASDILTDAIEDKLSNLINKKDLENILENADESLAKSIEDKLSFSYDKQDDSKYRSKYSVSEIKHAAMEEVYSQEITKPSFIYEEDEAYVPKFMLDDADKISKEDNKTPAGALYGTAMHRFMECFDFAREDYKESVDEQFDFMKKTGLLPEDEASRISIKKLKVFMQSDLAKRMHLAANNENLFVEQPFVFGSNAKELFSDDDATDEMILIQGIIDVFFKEEDGIALLDYKTDKVDAAAELVVRYEKQLQLYKDAITKAYHIPVKEILIYSFCLDETIPLGV